VTLLLRVMVCVGVAHIHGHLRHLFLAEPLQNGILQCMCVSKLKKVMYVCV